MNNRIIQNRTKMFGIIAVIGLVQFLLFQLLQCSFTVEGHLGIN